MSIPKGTAAHLGRAECPEPKWPISRRFWEGEGLLVLWLPPPAPVRLAASAGAPSLGPAGRVWPGSQVTACPWGSAAGPPAVRGPLGPRSPGWRCSPKGRSAAPGGGRHGCRRPGPRPPWLRSGQSRQCLHLRAPHPGYTRGAESFLRPHGAPRPRRGPQSSGRGPRAAASKGHSESPAQRAQRDPGTAGAGHGACGWSAARKEARTFGMHWRGCTPRPQQLGRKGQENTVRPDSAPQIPGVRRRMFPLDSPAAPGPLMTTGLSPGLDVGTVCSTWY